MASIQIDVRRSLSRTIALVQQRGPAGKDGKDGGGTQVLYGNGAPDNAIGQNGDTYVNRTTGDFYSKQGGVWLLSANMQGPAGWSPIFASATDSNRQVLQLVDYVGGAGTKPSVLSGGLAQYVGATGLTTTIANAVDFLGKWGWSPVFAAVADGARIVLKLADYVGGTGTKPSVAGSGSSSQYVGATGLTTIIANATDVRGPQGPQGVGTTADQVVVTPITPYTSTNVQSLLSEMNGKLTATNQAALAQQNVVVNGFAQVSQEVGFAGASAAGYIADQWRAYGVNGPAVNVGALAGRPWTNPVPQPTLQGGFSISCQTALASPASNAYAGIETYIEGNRMATLGWGGTSNAQSVTVSFVAISSIAWTGYVTIQGADNGNPSVNRRSHFRRYQLLANTPTLVSLTFPAPTGGAWDTGTGIGMTLRFVAVAGSGYQGAANTWFAGSGLNGDILAASDQTNLCSAVGQALTITGVTVLPGAVDLTPLTLAQYANLARPYQDELRLCQRYFQLVSPSHRFNAVAANVYGDSAYPYPTPLRGTPSATLATAGGRSNASAITFYPVNAYGGRYEVTSAAAGDCYGLNDTFYLNARLI